jgi:sulfate transport system permease protein
VGIAVPSRPGARRDGRLGTGLSLGVITTFLTVVVVLPIAALVWETKKAGTESFWQALSNPEAVSALETTFIAAFVVVAIDAVLGTLTAWVLVRDDFRGKSLVNAVIDLPFALPTIVAGLTLLTLYGPTSPVGLHIAYTRGSVVLALCFVTLPFVVRTVQPVLIELDPEMEQAARSLGASDLTVFRKVVLPNLVPGILSGCVLALARALGEIGAVVTVTGGLPYRTEVASFYIYKQVQGYNTGAAAAIAVVLLVAAFVLILAFGAVRFSLTRHERA